MQFLMTGLELIISMAPEQLDWLFLLMTQESRSNIRIDKFNATTKFYCGFSQPVMHQNC